MDIIQLKLKKDLLEKCAEYIKDVDIDKEEFTTWITQRIDHHISQKKITFTTNSCKHCSKDRCTARIWKDNAGVQCTHRRVSITYCKKHETMLQEEGVLRFGDIREPQPTCDLIKLRNGKE